MFPIIWTAEVKTIRSYIRFFFTGDFYTLAKRRANQSPFSPPTPPSIAVCCKNTEPCLGRYFSGHALVLSLILCLASVFCPAGWRQTDHPC